MWRILQESHEKASDLEESQRIFHKSFKNPIKKPRMLKNPKESSRNPTRIPENDKVWKIYEESFKNPSRILQESLENPIEKPHMLRNPWRIPKNPKESSINPSRIPKMTKFGRFMKNPSRIFQESHQKPRLLKNPKESFKNPSRIPKNPPGILQESRKMTKFGKFTKNPSRILQESHQRASDLEESLNNRKESFIHPRIQIV